MHWKDKVEPFTVSVVKCSVFFQFIFIFFFEKKTHYQKSSLFFQKQKKGMILKINKSFYKSYSIIFKRNSSTTGIVEKLPLTALLFLFFFLFFYLNYNACFFVHFFHCFPTERKYFDWQYIEVNISFFLFIKTISIYFYISSYISFFRLNTKSIDKNVW